MTIPESIRISGDWGDTPLDLTVAIIAQTFLIILFIATIFILFPVFLVTLPMRLLYRKCEEDAINELVGHW